MSPANGGLQPGKIFLIDMKQGRIVDDNEIKRELVDKRPWKDGSMRIMIPAGRSAGAEQRASAGS